MRTLPNASAGWMLGLPNNMIWRVSVFYVAWIVVQLIVEVCLRSLRATNPHLSPVAHLIRFEVTLGVSALVATRLSRFISLDVKTRSLGLRLKTLLPYLILGFALELLLLFAAVKVVGWGHSGLTKRTYAHFPFPSVIVLYLLTSVVEEVAYRGVMLQTVESTHGTWLALAVSLGFFGFDHMLGGYGIADCLLVVSQGLLFSGAYLVTRSLWLPIGLHWGWDFALSLFRGDDGFVGIYQADHSFSIANFVALLLQLYLGLFLVYVAYRKRRWRSGTTDEHGRANVHK